MSLKIAKISIELMRCVGDCPQLIRSPYGAYWPPHCDTNLCSWPIAVGYDIKEVSMTRLNALLYPTWKLCHRMCPDEVCRRLSTAHQITIWSILATIASQTFAHGPLQSGNYTTHTGTKIV